MPAIGVIGGSGFYDMPGLADVRDETVATPFGEPSDTIRIGRLDGVEVAFLPRHGRGHRIPPTAVNARANIWVLKSLGVQWIISVSAVGSMREHIEPLHVVVPDQLIDRTRQRPMTFFDTPGLVVHVGMGEPFSAQLSKVIAEAAEAEGRARASRRNLRLHRRSPVLHPRRIRDLSILGRGRDRHDRTS